MEEDDEANPADEEDDAIDSDAEYSDDEDTSWKVRRASSKCISALFLARPDLMVPVYQEVRTLTSPCAIHARWTTLQQSMGLCRPVHC
eukprot:14978267-Ditylum_brightwellii.AAC.1